MIIGLLYLYNYYNTCVCRVDNLIIYLLYVFTVDKDIDIDIDIDKSLFIVGVCTT